LHSKARFKNEIKPNIDRALAGERVQFKHWIQLPEENRCLDAVHTPLVGQEGEVIGVVITARDITDLENAERDLILSEQRYRTIVEIANECVKTVSADGSLINMNPAGLSMIEAESF